MILSRYSLTDGAYHSRQQDAFVSAKHVSTQGLGFLAHGAGCCLAFLFTLKPFLMFCCPDFLIVSVTERD